MPRRLVSISVHFVICNSASELHHWHRHCTIKPQPSQILQQSASVIGIITGIDQVFYSESSIDRSYFHGMPLPVMTLLITHTYSQGQHVSQLQVLVREHHHTGFHMYLLPTGPMLHSHFWLKPRIKYLIPINPGNNNIGMACLTHTCHTGYQGFDSCSDSTTRSSNKGSFRLTAWIFSFIICYHDWKLGLVCLVNSCSPLYCLYWLTTDDLTGIDCTTTLF
jgi:hypothetical protein